MDEVIQPSIITAIADADFEGMVSKALFENGWNVVARLLDFSTLEKVLSEESYLDSLVIYSVDLPGISVEKLEKLADKGISFIGFDDGAQSNRGFKNLTSRPISPEELVTFIRANIRSPLSRAPLLQRKPKIKARIIAVGSAGNSTGATTLALNLAYELSQLEKKTLLIDAHFQSIAIATLLDLHRISDEDKWRDLSDFLSVSEVTQNNVSDFSSRTLEAAAYFDYIVIDLGSLLNLENDLSDRRWSSQVKIWASHFAQDLYLCSGSDHLQLTRLKKLSIELSQVKIPARISVFIKPADVENKKGRAQALDLKPLTPREFEYLPFDSKHCSMARVERTTLAEINPKAPLCKAIAAIAKRITE
jgi:hypothetical protein